MLSTINIVIISLCVLISLGFILIGIFVPVKKCKKGTYSSNSLRSLFIPCKDCEPGSYSDEDGSTECKKCGKGTFSDSGFAKCIDCGLGTYQDEEGTDTCKICGIGKTTDNTASISQDDCKECEPGTFNNIGSGDCIKCPPGFFEPNIGSSGEYNKDFEQLVCSNMCPENTYLDKAGGKSQDECIQCKEGTFSGKGAHKCRSCPFGQYKDENGTCTDNPVGTYSKDPSNDTFHPCEIGTYQDQIGQSNCISCPLGTYQDEKGQTTCKNCSLGTYQDKTGQTTCNTCPPGKSNSNTGSKTKTDCSPCPTGTFQTFIKNGLEKNQVCKVCSEQSYNPGSSATSCFACPTSTDKKIIVNSNNLQIYDDNDLLITDTNQLVPTSCQVRNWLSDIDCEVDDKCRLYSESSTCNMDENKCQFSWLPEPKPCRNSWECAGGDCINRFCRSRGNCVSDEQCNSELGIRCVNKMSVPCKATDKGLPFGAGGVCMCGYSKDELPAEGGKLSCWGAENKLCNNGSVIPDIEGGSTKYLSTNIDSFWKNQLLSKSKDGITEEVTSSNKYLVIYVSISVLILTIISIYVGKYLRK